MRDINGVDRDAMSDLRVTLQRKVRSNVMLNTRAWVETLEAIYFYVCNPSAELAGKLKKTLDENGYGEKHIVVQTEQPAIPEVESPT